MQQSDSGATPLRAIPLGFRKEAPATPILINEGQSLFLPPETSILIERPHGWEEFYTHDGGTLPGRVVVAEQYPMSEPEKHPVLHRLLIAKGAINGLSAAIFMIIMLYAHRADDAYEWLVKVSSLAGFLFTSFLMWMNIRLLQGRNRNLYRMMQMPVKNHVSQSDRPKDPLS